MKENICVRCGCEVENDKELCDKCMNICSRCGCEVENGIELCDKCMYEAQVEMEEYNRMYEPTYNPEDGSM